VYGIEFRHPFFDRRLVELALALPEEQRQQADAGKIVLRRALGGHLPAPVRERTSKVHYSELYFEAMEALGGEAAFADLTLARLGWVRGDRVRRLYHEAAAAARARQSAMCQSPPGPSCALAATTASTSGVVL